MVGRSEIGTPRQSLGGSKQPASLVEECSAIITNEGGRVGMEGGGAFWGCYLIPAATGDAVARTYVLRVYCPPVMLP